MDRSLYPDGVEVRQNDLQNTEDTKIFHTLRRYVDSNTGGVVSGLLVTTNVLNQNTIDIASGRGYAPNGEYIESKSAITGVALADSTVNTRNFILLVYTETNDDIKPHETFVGDSRPTKANRSVRLEVLTEAAYNSLPQTDENLNNTDLDRSLVVAIIVSPGPGVSISSSNIVLPSQFTGGVTATKVTNNVTGADVIRISSTTPTGIGTLTFTFSTGELEWVAPNDTSGTPAVVSGGGIFSLASQPSGNTLRLNVQDTLLPSSDQSDDISITNIYTQEVPSHSARDAQHRSLVGSGVPTANNPHGLTPGDLGLGETQTEFHQEVFHSPGITADSDPATLEPVVNAGGLPHALDIASMSLGDKLIAGGFVHTSTLSTSYSMDDVLDDVQALYQFYLVTSAGTGIATLEKRERVRFDDSPPPTLASVVQLADVSDNVSAGAGQIEYLAGPYLRFKAPGDSGFGPSVVIPTDGDNPVPRFVRLYNEDETQYIDIFAQDDTGGAWGAVGFTIEDLTFSAPLTTSESTNRHLIANAPFSGSATAFLGFGFGAGNAPNDVIDKRQFGNVGPKDMQDILYETTLARFPVRQNGAHIQLLPTEVFPESLNRATGAPSKSVDDGTMLMYRNPTTGTVSFYIWKQNSWDLIS